jgi:hypothetical protein
MSYRRCRSIGSILYSRVHCGRTSPIFGAPSHTAVNARYRGELLHVEFRPRWRSSPMREPTLTVMIGGPPRPFIHSRCGVHAPRLIAGIREDGAFNARIDFSPGVQVNGGALNSDTEIQNTVYPRSFVLHAKLRFFLKK